MGDALKNQNDLPGALASYSQSLAIAETLASVDPGNAQLQRDLSVSYEKVGDVQREQSDLVGAMASYQRFLKIAGMLAKSDPGNAQWQRDAMAGYWRLAAVGDAPVENYGKALAILKRLQAEKRLNPVDEQYIGQLEGIIAGLGK